MSNKGAQITIVGNITRPAELRYTQSGIPVASFTIAENIRKFDREQNQWVDDRTHWHRVVAWRSNAEAVANVDVGTKLIVLGSLNMREWEDAEGSRRQSWETQAETIGTVMFGSKQTSSPASSQQQQNQGWQGNNTNPGQQTTPWESPGNEFDSPMSEPPF